MEMSMFENTGRMNGKFSRLEQFNESEKEKKKRKKTDLNQPLSQKNWKLNMIDLL